MGTVGIVAQLFGKSDYRETRTLSRILIAIIIAILIILLKPIIINKIFFSNIKRNLKLINTYISVKLPEFIIYLLLYLGIQKINIKFTNKVLSTMNIFCPFLYYLNLCLGVFEP